MNATTAAYILIAILMICGTILVATGNGEIGGNLLTAGGTLAAREGLHAVEPK